MPASVAYHHGSATAGEASPRKYFLVGRNRMRLLAKNATGGQLVRWGWAMALYDVAYVLFVALTDRTLSPLRGRVAGLREWRRYRRAGAAARGPPRSPRRPARSGPGASARPTAPTAGGCLPAPPSPPSTRRSRTSPAPRRDRLRLAPHSTL